MAAQAHRKPTAQTHGANPRRRGSKQLTGSPRRHKRLGRRRGLRATQALLEMRGPPKSQGKEASCQAFRDHVLIE